MVCGRIFEYGHVGISSKPKSRNGLSASDFTEGATSGTNRLAARLAKAGERMKTCSSRRGEAKCSPRPARRGEAGRGVSVNRAFRSKDRTSNEDEHENE